MYELDERESARFYVSHPIEYHPIEYQELSPHGSENGRQTTSMMSVGTGGLEFIANHPFSLGGICAFWIKIPDFQIPVLAVGKVVWQNEVDATYHVGAQWVYWQDDATKELTLQFCRTVPSTSGRKSNPSY